jgi:uncharacterized protein with HEPN domain
MKRVWRDYKDDIINALDEIGDFTKGMEFHDFSSDRKTINAFVRSLEVIGEAAKRMPEEVREKNPLIPWKRMAGMRDKLIHEYSGVDMDIVWAVIKTELPSLRPLIAEIAEDDGQT